MIMDNHINDNDNSTKSINTTYDVNDLPSRVLLLSPNEKQALIKELTLQNEISLEQHKKKLEQEFQQRMELLMASFTPPPNRNIRSPNSLDEVNDEFYNAASRSNPPQIHIFDGREKASTKLSAIKDISTTKENTIVMSTKASNTSINIDTTTISTSNITNKQKEKKISGWHPPESYFVSPPSINKNIKKTKQDNNTAIDRHVEYFQSKYGPSSGTSVASGASSRNEKYVDKNSDLINNGSISDNTSIGTADMNDNSSLVSNITTDTSLHNIKRVKKKFTPTNSNKKDTSNTSTTSNDYENKFDNVTKLMLRKSQFLLDECSTSSRSSKKNVGDSLYQLSYSDSLKEKSETDNATFSLPSLESHSYSNMNSNNSIVSLFKSKRDKDHTRSKKSSKHKNNNDLDTNSYSNSIDASNTFDGSTISLADDWSAKNGRVMNVPPESLENIHTDNQWKNEIAKHILSVYATSKVPVDLRQSNLIMEDINLNFDGSNESNSSVAKFLKEEEHNDNNSIGQDLNDNSTIETTSIISANTMVKTKKSTKNSMKPIEEFKSDMADRLINANGGDISIGEDITLHPTQNEEWLPSFTSNSKYRTCTMVHTADGEVPVRGSPRVFPIWFVSSGDVYNDWSLLPNSDKLTAHLKHVYEHKLYRDYIELVQNLILDELRKITGDGYDPGGLGIRRYSSKPSIESLLGKPAKVVVETKKPNDPNTARQDGAMNFWEELNYVPDPELPKTIPRKDVNTLWKNLIFTCNAFAVICIENNNPELGMDLLNKAEGMAKRDDILPSKMRKEMKAHVYNGMALYFFKKASTATCLKFTEKAYKLHEECGNVEYAAICLLHKSASLTQSCKFKEAHKVIMAFMEFLEEGDLATLTCTPRQLCLVAIGYHNLAVVEMKLECPDFAAKNIQKARKVAQLCLSYSNRWLDAFRWTQEVVMEDVKFNLAVRDRYGAHLLKLINPLTDMMFSHSLV